MSRGEVGGCHREGDSTWRLALVSARWTIVLLSCTNGPKKKKKKKHFCHLVGAPFYTAFKSTEVLSAQSALTIECSLMRGCGVGHPLQVCKQDVYKPHAVNFFVLFSHSHSHSCPICSFPALPLVPMTFHRRRKQI